MLNDRLRWVVRFGRLTCARCGEYSWGLFLGFWKWFRGQHDVFEDDEISLLLNDTGMITVDEHDFLFFWLLVESDALEGRGLTSFERRLKGFEVLSWVFARPWTEDFRGFDHAEAKSTAGLVFRGRRGRKENGTKLFRRVREPELFFVNRDKCVIWEWDGCGFRVV